MKVIGQRYPLVLMHGGPGLDYSTLLPLRPCADQFTLISYDHRYNGRSGGTDVSAMTWENLTADADELRQTLGFDKWAVLGHSFGGMVALEYALRYPHRLSHLFLFDTCGDTHWMQHNAPEILAKRGYRATAVQAARRFYNGQLSPREVFPSVLKFTSADFYQPKLLNLIHEVLFGPRVKMRPETLIFGFSKLLMGWMVMDRPSEIKVPTLVLAGRHDFLFSPAHQAILADRLPIAQLKLIELAGHNAHAEQSAKVIQSIREFMAAVNQPVVR
ncbi:MAG: alpha/beta hydrolase [Chloroflexi bacterium AL-W]|nr:alpha/beta hydrolase [Chloroflexi bacterium AL-N1]NOK64888.1 alpha/beta hydrolase [Chloroflexi bacterium AL-N10]NOK76658.1 alpha/beta hydrolase [Chloroflexi bacterium AL-N5]NOK84549.1 alpha/beta hydrolase [Chloroflexi bacterium AL-W]NOK86626.1 alpha/beta hydrolase [Chloroflexi bacterium AL-N15]